MLCDLPTAVTVRSILQCEMNVSLAAGLEAAGVEMHWQGLGVELPEVFARLGITESQFGTRVVQPYVEKLENPSDVTKILIETTLLAAWDAANTLRNMLATPMPPPSSSATSSETMTTPTTFKPGQWVQQFESSWTPTRLLTPISLSVILKKPCIRFDWASSTDLLPENLMNGRWVGKKFDPSSGWATVDALEAIRWVTTRWQNDLCNRS